MKNSSVLFVLLFLVSCSSYVNKIHRQIDQEEGVAEEEQPRDERPRDPYANYRHRRFSADKDKRPVKNPQTFSLGDASSMSGSRLPPVKRDYRPERSTADDFRDNENDGSLWANQGSSSSLFTYQNDKRTGDMVIINVLESLRNQISAELKRSFPEKSKRGSKAGDAKPAAAATAPGAAPAAPGAPAEGEMDMKIYDKISGTVTEEISKDYILLRGRKEVIFKKEKRSIEVQGLVSRKDIMENDYVNSDKLLESRVYILRANQ